MFPATPRMHVQPRLVAAYRMLREGNTARAKAACRRVLRETPDDAAATHLLGLVHQADGDAEFAEHCLQRSIELEPAAAGFRANLGALLRDLGRLHEAERTFREAIALDGGCRPARAGLVRTLIEMRQPGAAEQEARQLTGLCESDPESWTLLATTLREQGRIAEAEALYMKSLDIAPGYAAAHQQLGTVWSRMERPEEALAAFRRARKLGSCGPGIARDMARVYLQMSRLAEAEQALSEAVRADPGCADTQLELARTRFMRGDEDFARDVVAAAGSFDREPRIAAALGTVMKKVGLHERAERQFESLIRRHGRSPDALSELASVQLELGRPAKARAPILEAVKAKPEDASVVENAVAVLLACGEPELAWYYVARQREQQPLDQGWLAYEAVVARLLDPDRYRELYDFERLIRVYDVEAPSGWTAIAEMNDALRGALSSRHGPPALPVDESFRIGSRTTRNLLHERDPAIQAAIRAFDGPLEDYVRAVGVNRAHPVSARSTGEARITDAWSIRLHPHGYHVNHFHRSGWISGTYYVATPAEADDTARMPGWLRFGEPRFPVPGANAERFIQPAAGRLVLFPSCMWHGSSPCQGTDPRLTISFDALPAGACSPGISR